MATQIATAEKINTNSLFGRNDSRETELAVVLLIGRKEIAVFSIGTAACCGVGEGKITVGVAHKANIHLGSIGLCIGTT